ncbi:integrase, partial [Xanthomonas citri pv. mangiferaeindicae]
MKSKITQSFVERATRPEPGKSVLYADTEMRGFYLIVTPTKRSFYVQYHVTYYLKGWLDKPLAEIGADRQGVRERHRRITERSGATSGDNTMRVLRSVYNRALRQFPDLPPNPIGNVDMNGIRRREVDASPEKLRAWGKAV